MKSVKPFCDHVKALSTGLTLIELMVVMAIVAVLAAISVPLYTGYIEKAKAEEAKSIVGALVTAEKTYKQRYRLFTNDINALHVDTQEASYFDFTIDNVDGGNTFRIKATVNASGLANGLPAGGNIIYSYDISQNPRGQWGGSLY